MTEVQEARSKWLDAETRIIELQRENMRLRSQLFEAQSKYVSLSAQLVISQSFAQAMTVAAFCGSSQGKEGGQ